MEYRRAIRRLGQQTFRYENYVFIDSVWAVRAAVLRRHAPLRWRHTECRGNLPERCCTKAQAIGVPRRRGGCVRLNPRGGPNAGAGSGGPLTSPRAAAPIPPETPDTVPNARPGDHVHLKPPGRGDNAAEADAVTLIRATRIIEPAIAYRDIPAGHPAMSVGGLGSKAPISVEIRRSRGRRGRDARGSESGCQSHATSAMAVHGSSPEGFRHLSNAYDQQPFH
jgi:hypothetical protein